MFVAVSNSRNWSGLYVQTSALTQESCPLQFWYLTSLLLFRLKHGTHYWGSAVQLLRLCLSVTSSPPTYSHTVLPFLLTLTSSSFLIWHVLCPGRSWVPRPATNLAHLSLWEKTPSPVLSSSLANTSSHLFSFPSYSVIIHCTVSLPDLTFPWKSVIIASWRAEITCW